jgi:uncharacterized spore protein YtfJ
MDVNQELERARAALSAERVYGRPVEKDGVTVIPAAKVAGGAGAGGGVEADGSESGGGGGFGLTARPAGALIIKPDGNVRWKGFLDLNRMIVGCQIVAIAFFAFVWLTHRSEARADMKARIASAAISRVGRNHQTD